MANDAAAREAALQDYLRELGLDTIQVEHEAVMTVDEAIATLPPMDGCGTKNLFLRDGKGRRHFLVVVPHLRRVDIGALARALDVSRLGMASPERLLRHLGVTPGAVGLLSLFNDDQGAVELVIDREVWQAGRVLTHSLRNTATLSLAHASLERFLAACSHPARVIDVPVAAG
jgi:Ala-tRNA(Pro) deacylase